MHYRENNIVLTSRLGFSATAAAAMVTGFGYAFLAAALLTVMGIVFTALFIQVRQHHQVRVKAATIHELR